MTKLAPLAAALLLGIVGTALAQQPDQQHQQGQARKAQPQPRPQLPNDQRPKADEHVSSGRTIGRGDTTSIGDQHGRPAGDALARPADPNTAAPADGTTPTARKGDTAATSSKTGVGAGSMGEDTGDKRRRPATAERPVGPDDSYSVAPGGRTPPPGSSGSSGQPQR
ncbi:hypothetical protein [Azospirillum sp. TSO22-1]|uniref:hypothetical protein n=1 Tax=Azospirillum sp. TSO22-1 TaxID=716789 RepID=UPI000D61189C|nr:hypothetical protein [Azospirillum sp. TSO22-1]PWC54915.1 hypothetical protein TSO221_06770 [Azospirillum sp. TSO22-1]